MKPISPNFDNQTIIMTRAFAKKASDPSSKEYRQLKEMISIFPTFKVQCHEIRKNPNKETYSGLDYKFMREYIISHVNVNKRKQALDELEEQIFLSKCHTVKYPAIKKWFLATYPEVKDNYGKVTNEIVEKKTVGFIFSDIDDEKFSA